MDFGLPCNFLHCFLLLLHAEWTPLGEGALAGFWKWNLLLWYDVIFVSWLCHVDPVVGQPPKKGTLMFEIIAAIKHCLVNASHGWSFLETLCVAFTDLQANAVQCVFACFGLIIVYCEMLGCESSTENGETLKSREGVKLWGEEFQ